MCLIANSLLVPRWATWDEFRRLEAEGLTMFGQMTAGSWIYIGTQGILQGTYQTFAAAGEKHYGSPDLAGRTILTAGLGGMGGAQPLAATMAGAAILCVEVDPSGSSDGSRRDTSTRRPTRSTTRSRACGQRRPRGARSPSGCSGTRPRSFPELVRRGERFDLVTDQTAAHDPLTGYVPPRPLARRGCRAPRRRPRRVPAAGARGDRRPRPRAAGVVRDAGSHVFDYGNNLRGEAREGGLEDAFAYPGFVPAYIRPLFCRGIGPFRWAALSGDPADIAAIDGELRALFPDDVLLQRWLELAPERVAFQGLPARICWLGVGDRATAGLAINELVRSGRVSAPVVIGRDHLDSGSVASPYRETEAMRDGSDAIADWPILNALLNTAAGATWVSVHHGGGVGIGNSIHAGMVVVADGTDDAADRLERVLDADPGTGVMRHADAGYEDALDAAREAGLDLPCRLARVARLLVRDLAQLATPAGRSAPLRGAELGAVDVVEDAFVLCVDGRIEAVGRMRDLPGLDGDVEELDGRGLAAVPGLVDCHTHACFAGDRVEEFSLRAAGASYEELHAAGGGILSTVRATRAAGEGGLRERLRAIAAGCSAPGTTTWEAKSGYGLDRDTELAQLRAIRAAGGVPTWLGAHAVPPEYAGRGRLSRLRCSPRCCPRRRELAEAADVFLERGAFDAAQARRYLDACRDAGLALRLHGDQFTESGAIPLAIELGARSVDHLEATGEDGVRALAASDVTGVLLPASALFLGRPMPPAPRARRRRRGGRARDGLQPRQRVLREPAARAARSPHAARPRAGRGARAPCTVNAAHVLGRADRTGRLAPGLRRRPRPRRRARLAPPRLPPRRRRDQTVVAGGAIAWSRAAY